jgi:hypothetical protein
MTIQTPDDGFDETPSYKIANQKIENLMAAGRQARLPLLHGTGAGI